MPKRPPPPRGEGGRVGINYSIWKRFFVFLWLWKIILKILKIVQNAYFSGGFAWLYSIIWSMMMRCIWCIVLDQHELYEYQSLSIRTMWISNMESYVYFNLFSLVFLAHWLKCEKSCVPFGSEFEYCYNIVRFCLNCCVFELCGSRRDVHTANHTQYRFCIR